MPAFRYTLTLRIFAALFLFGYGHPLVSFPVKFTPGKTYKYIYNTELTLNEAHSHRTTLAKKDVGFKFSAEVEVTTVWSNSINFIRVLIVGPQIHGVAQADVSRELKTLPKLPVYFQWEAGQVGLVFAGDDDSTLAINIKKGLISLFQFRLDDGTFSEVDASGECKVVYRKVNGQKVTKSKTACKSMDTAGYFSQVNELLGVSLSSSTEVDFTFNEDSMASVVSHEEWLVRVNLEERVSSVIAVKQTLELKSIEASDPVDSDSFEDLLKALEAERKHKLLRTPLGTVFEPRQCTIGCASPNDLMAKYRTNFFSNKIGKLDAAEAFRDLVRAARDMPKDGILNLLKDKLNEQYVLHMIDVACAAQTLPAQTALMEYLNFENELEIDKPERYLLATALSTHPSETVLLDLLHLFEKTVPNENLRESIGEALGAVTNTYYRTKGQANHQVVSNVRSAFLKKLASCVDPPCQLMTIRALANAGLPETLDVLIDYAEKENISTVSEASLRALRRIDRQLLTSERRDRLKKIFHQKTRGYDTSVRSQALSIILETSPTLEELHEIIMETTDPWNTDYSMYIQSRVFDSMRRDDKIREMVKEILSNPDLSNYNVLAPNGKSLAFTSFLAENPTVSYFMYVENSRSGVMKRSGMDVDILSPVQKLPLYSVGIFAAGLEGLIADEVDAEEAETEVTAGMALDMVGVSLRPITFFTGKGGLMGAIWSAPSELISALQLNFLLQDHSERIHLQNGLIAELDVQGISSIDLSGKLSVSLWNKNSNSLIRNRGALLLQSSLTISTSAFRTGIDSVSKAESLIDFRTDVDFYDGVKMCLQMSRPGLNLRHNVTKYESARGFTRTFTSKINRLTRINPISYPLPGRNAENCRLIKPE